MPPKKTDYDAVVIGAGFGGIRSLWELCDIDLSVKCLEAGSDVGGAWYWNSYPGARTDSEAWAYALNFAPDAKNEWDYSERYPPQKEVQQYIRRLAARYNLLQHIQFDTRVSSAHYDNTGKYWILTDQNGRVTTCRYFIPATGPLSLAKQPPFSGLDSFKGEWYQAATWPKEHINFKGKRIAVVGTGATGVQIVPKLAATAKQLTVYQRTPNYVLPGRNYAIDEHQADEIRANYGATMKHASEHPFGLAMNFTGNTVKNVPDAENFKQVLDGGWECGGFHYQFETFDDLFTSPESNSIASEYIRNKIRTIVKDPKTAEVLCPKYPFLSKRPPCGHFYYEAFNRRNVKLVDIRSKTLEIYEKGIRTDAGDEDEFDMIIFALGYDAGTGALSEIDVRGIENKSLKETWGKRLQTYAGVLVPGFPNMFPVAGPHIPFGNMPVVADLQVGWIGKAIRYMEEQKLADINVSEGASDAWGQHVEEAFQGTLFHESAKEVGAWFVGGNIPGKASAPLFYFGGIPTWVSWMNKASDDGWKGMSFTPMVA